MSVDISNEINKLKEEGASMHLRKKAESKMFEVSNKLKALSGNNFVNYEEKLDGFIAELKMCKEYLKAAE